MNSQIVITLLSVAWLVMFILGRKQYEDIKKQTLQLLTEGADRAKARNIELSVQEYYDQLQPVWEEMVRRTARFVLHKTELFPVPATPDYVRKRMNFTPAWLGAYLRLHHYKVTAVPELDEQINKILAMANNKPSARKQSR